MTLLVATPAITAPTGRTSPPSLKVASLRVVRVVASDDASSTSSGARTRND